MTESKPTRAELAFEEWNASSASDKFEIDSIETYTAFLAGYEAAQFESKSMLPWHGPEEPLGTFGFPFFLGMLGLNRGGDGEYVGWVDSRELLASFELWKKRKEGAE